MKLIIDLETNGFLDKLDVIHCIVAKDIETQKVYSYNPDNLNDGLELLKKATLLVGHNIQGFDLPALDKVFGFKYSGEIFDSEVLILDTCWLIKRPEFFSSIIEATPNLSVEAWVLPNIISFSKTLFLSGVFFGA